MDDDTNFPVTGGTGLAMEVGRQRSEFDRLHDDTNRDLDTIRAELADLRSNIDARERQVLDLIDRLADTVATVTQPTDRNEKAGNVPDDASSDDDESSEPLPTRDAGERPSDYRKRVVAWARATGEAEPPAVGLVANGTGYAVKVARFYDSDFSQQNESPRRTLPSSLGLHKG